MSREVHNCDQGEVNTITREVWCNKFREFCHSVEGCGVKNIESKPTVEGANK